ncbi:DUF397 domain-containing protein [Streptomyces sp. NPDC006997]
MAIRDSKSPTSPVLHLPFPTWSAFLAHIRQGEVR